MEEEVKARARSDAQGNLDRAKRAELWDEGKLSGKDWLLDPEAVPRVRESEQISIRLPTRLLRVLRALAKRRSIGYQVLLRDWLDDRAREEATREIHRLEGSANEARVFVFTSVAKLGVEPERLKDSKDRKRHVMVPASS